MYLSREFLKFYIEKIKEHEALRLSTDERNAFWKEYWRQQNENR